MNPRPTGTVTFLFTDIESSTKLWEQNPDTMRPALARHDEILRAAIEGSGGYVFKTVGDAFCAAFPTAPDALAAALNAQQSLQKEPWDLETLVRVRMGLHTGSAEERDGDYFGTSLNRAARLMAAGHGGQVLLSEATQALVRDALHLDTVLLDLGKHRLKDLGRSEQVFQLLHPSLPDDFPPLNSLNNPELPNNLPQQATSFIGREKESSAVKALMQQARLVTLTGAGGSGKSRLSLQVASDLLDGDGEGVWLVELAALADPALVPQAVAEALGIKERTGQTIQKTLVDALRLKRLLLVLDNCEHLLAACASLATDILRNCPGVHILASSREPLGVAGEQTYRVPSLSLPDPKAAQTGDALSQYEAVRLFIERAQAVQPSFAVTDANAPAVAQVCWRLDGIPLALELAAARVRAMPVELVMARLDDRFRLLTGGSRTALPRQQTLRALIDWSYDLLAEGEKALLQRLSVFAGGWTLEAAERVCAGEPVEDWEVLDLLTGLVDKSLVAYEEEGRYRLLETVRQYALDRLTESKQRETACRQHLNYFLALAEEARPHLSGPEQAQWLSVLETEHDNLRQALTLCLDRPLSEPETVEQGLRLGTALQPFWNMHGHLREGRDRLMALLAPTDTQAYASARAAALKSLAVIVRIQYDYAEAQPLLEESLRLFRELGERRGIAGCLHELGILLAIKRDPAAISLAEESLALWREIGDGTGIAEGLDALGWATEQQADLARAESCFIESLAIRQEIGDKGGMALSLNNLGDVATDREDYAAARSFYRESLILWRDLGDRWRVAGALVRLGYVGMAQGDAAAAWAWYEEALAIYREFGSKDRMTDGLDGLGDIAYRREDYNLACTLYEESLVLSRETGHRIGIGYGLLNLGNVALKTGEYASARSRYRESLSLFQENGDRISVVYLLEAFASLAVQEAQAARGIRLFGAAAAWREVNRTPLPPHERTQYEPYRDAARLAMSDQALEAARAAGQLMTLDEAAAYALEGQAE